MSEKLRYPIGKATIPTIINKDQILHWIETIEAFPAKLEQLVSNLSQVQLDTPYRAHGWTIRQVIHHCYDSHHNSYIRFKWALTEENPVIKAYYEDRWAELFDTREAPIQLSLDSIKALHAKWVYLLKGLSEKELAKEFIHPDGNEHVSLAKNVGLYAWHCNHHYAHIYNLMEKKQWL